MLVRGEHAISIADQVAKLARIVRELGFNLATPLAARTGLALKRGDRTNF